jgi:hypothetical protein
VDILIVGKQKTIHIKDRILGDEWQNWKGYLNKDAQNANTGKRAFLGILFISIITFGFLSFSLFYLISPRLAEFHPILPKLFVYILFIIFFIVLTWFILLILSIITSKNLLQYLSGYKISIKSFVPFVQRFGVHLGISKDRIGNSFIKVSNALIRIYAKNVNPHELLIMLPRCLKKSILKKITTFSKQSNISVVVVPGGEMARRIINEKKPNAIISIACERDLVCGICDIDNRIKVIGIPNIRPEGPCKNTHIDLQEFEKAINTFLSQKINLKDQESNTVNSVQS